MIMLAAYILKVKVKIMDLIVLLRSKLITISNQEITIAILECGQIHMMRLNNILFIVNQSV